MEVQKALMGTTVEAMVLTAEFSKRMYMCDTFIWMYVYLLFGIFEISQEIDRGEPISKSKPISSQAIGNGLMFMNKFNYGFCILFGYHILTLRSEISFLGNHR